MAWLGQHLRVLASTAFKLARSPVAAGLNVIVLGVAIAFPAGLYLILSNVQHGVRSVSAEPQLTLFLALDANRNDVAMVEKRLQQNSEIAHLLFVPRQRALEQLKQKSGLGGVVDTLDTNPLPDAFVVDAAHSAPDALERLRRELSSLPKIEHVQLDSAWAQRLDAALRVGRLGVTLLAVVLAFALVAITFNTIRLQILTQREEIEVALLIGATAAFVRRPFLYYGALVGMLAGCVGWGLLIVAMRVLNGGLADLSYFYGANWQLTALPLPDGLSMIAFGAVLGWLGAWLSVGRQIGRLRVA
jgi:cell division transport system permease protein